MFVVSFFFVGLFAYGIAAQNPRLVVLVWLWCWSGWPGNTFGTWPPGLPESLGFVGGLLQLFGAPSRLHGGAYLVQSTAAFIWPGLAPRMLGNDQVVTGPLERGGSPPALQ